MGGVNIKDIKSNAGSATIFSNKGNFNAPLIVGADGRNSKTRFFANIKSFFYDYNQVAFVFNISHVISPIQKLLKGFSSRPLALLQCKIIKKVLISWDSRFTTKEKLLKNKNFSNEFEKICRSIWSNYENL